MAMRIGQLFEVDSIKEYTLTVETLYGRLTTGKDLINPNPIGQRPPSQIGYQNSKNVGIIETLLRGFGIGVIYLRDITVYDGDHRIRKQYPLYGYLTIDGGHRCRAIRQFIENKFYVTIGKYKKVYFRDLQAASPVRMPELMGMYEKFMQKEILIGEMVCTSRQAQDWFWGINAQTQITAIEVIMADDESPICEFIRRNTWYVAEYQNRQEIHPIFKVYLSDESDFNTDIWNKPNTGGSFYYHAFITLAKAIASGNTDAGESKWNKIVADNYAGVDNLNKNIEETWNRFFNDLYDFQDIVRSKKGLDDDAFGFFSCIWFYLLGKYGKKGFKLDIDRFSRLLNRVRTLMTIKNGTQHSKHDDAIVEDITGKLVEMKPMVRQYSKAFAYGDRQEFLGKMIFDEMVDEGDGDTGIIVLDTVRSLSLKDREDKLAAQFGKCWIEYKGYPCKSAGKKLTVSDCDLAHDIPYSLGGKAVDGVMMCRECHSGQGLLNLDQYVKHITA